MIILFQLSSAINTMVLYFKYTDEMIGYISYFDLFNLDDIFVIVIVKTEYLIKIKVYKQKWIY